MSSEPRTRLRKFLFTAVLLLVFLTSLLLGELYTRSRSVSTDFAKFLFFTEFKIDRWEYLSQNSTIHQLDVVMESFPNIQYTEQPEANRPPFDQIPHPFEVKHNRFGFRDQDFVLDRNKRQIMVLGDSIAFGKGVTVEERFTTLLAERLENVQVFNLGLQGCTAECMSRLWKQYATYLEPDLLLIQASGNDLDQILWKESAENRLPGFRLRALRIVQHSRLAQWVLFLRGTDRISQQMRVAKQTVVDSKGSFVTAMYESANRRNVPIWIINLPYAYNYHYGEHMTELCTQNACRPEIKVEFGRSEEDLNCSTGLFEATEDFVSKTAQQMPLTEEQLSRVFPYRRCFHDVVHLTKHGHAVVSEQVYSAIKDTVSD